MSRSLIIICFFSLKQYFQTEYDDDIPYFWQYAGHTIAYALLEVKPEHKFKQNEIYKHIGDTLSNYAGSNQVKFTEAFSEKINGSKVCFLH